MRYCTPYCQWQPPRQAEPPSGQNHLLGNARNQKTSAAGCEDFRPTPTPSTPPPISPGPSRTSISTKNQPCRPTVRPSGGERKLPPKCLQVSNFCALMGARGLRGSRASDSAERIQGKPGRNQSFRNSHFTQTLSLAKTESPIGSDSRFSKAPRN